MLSSLRNKTQHLVKGGLFALTVSAVTLMAGSTSYAQSTTAEDFNNEGSSGGTFQKIWVGARAAGMGGAYSALADDITALYWNPAGIAKMNATNVGASYTRWFADITHNFVGATMPISDKYRIGVSLTVVDYGAMERSTLEKDYNAGTFNANDLALGVTVAGALTERFSFGGTVKYVRNAILDLSADGIAFDAGSLYQTDFYNTKISLALSNLGPERSFQGNSLSLLVENGGGVNQVGRPLDTRLATNPFPIPLSFRIGAATDVFQNTVEDQNLNVAFDFAAHSDGPETFNIGAEYLWNNLLALRAGYAFNQDQLGLGAGVGFRYKSEDFNGNIDYSLNTTQSLGSIHRISIAAMFQ
jgi:hypothetical protein